MVSCRSGKARQTRRQITEAARELFTERGYGGATIEASAQQAGVATETVYAAFGNKPSLLTHLIDVAVTGDDEPVPLLERPEIKQTMAERDQQVQIRQFARQMRAVMARMAPLHEVMRTAAKSEADIAELRERIIAERRRGMQQFVRALAANGPLRPEMSIAAAADQVYALSSAESFTGLTVEGDLPGAPLSIIPRRGAANLRPPGHPRP